MERSHYKGNRLYAEMTSLGSLQKDRKAGKEKTNWKQMGLQNQERWKLQSKIGCFRVQPDLRHRFLRELLTSNQRCELQNHVDSNSNEQL